MELKCPNPMEAIRLIFANLLRIKTLWWRLVGGRKVVVFGHVLKLNPETEFPTSWRFPLPNLGQKSRIVRYADFVQAHALVQAVDSLQGAVYAVDVGAYHGAYAVILGALVKRRGGKVLAVEPNPESFRILKDNIRRNKLEDTVISVQCAVSDVENRTNTLTLDGSQSHILKGTECRSGGKGVAIQIRRLDSLLLEHGFPRMDVVMIDVEGAELEVLRSFLPWRQATLPVIFCELHCNEWSLFGHGAEDFTSFMKSQGLTCMDTYLEEHWDFANKAYLGPCLLRRLGCLTRSPMEKTN